MSPVTTSLRVAFAVAGLVALPGERPPALARGAEADGDAGAPALERELALVPGGGSLASRYGLEVTSELPDPPDLGAVPARVVTTVCPVQVRAIVSAEPVAESFAVVSTGASSRIVRVGEGFRAGGGLVSVAAIESSALVLRAGDRLVRCEFLR